MQPSAPLVDLAGRRWLLWCLLALDDRAGTRFTDLAAEPGLSRRVLSSELAELQRRGLVLRRTYQRTPTREAYWLSARGRAARSGIESLLHVLGGATPAAVGASREESSAAARADLPDLVLHEQVERSIGPVVAYDRSYRAQLAATLRCWLDSDASTTIAARTLGVHRHTVRYRLARIHELCGLDPHVLADREQLVAGLRAHAELARRGRLPR